MVESVDFAGSIGARSARDGKKIIDRLNQRSTEIRSYTVKHQNTP